MFKSDTDSQEKLGMIYLFSNVLLAGIFPLLAKMSLNSLSPVIVLLVSTFFATIYFSIIVTIKNEWGQIKTTESKMDIFWSIIIIGFAYQLLYFIGLNKTVPGNAAIISLTEIFFSFLFFHIWRKENFSLTATLGSLIIIFGVSIILSPRFDGFHYGDIFIISAAAIAPVGNYFQRKARMKVTGNILMLFRSFFSMLMLLTITPFFMSDFSVNNLKYVFPFLALNGILMLGMMKSFWVEAIHRISVIKANAMGSIAPIITLTIAWIFLKTHPTNAQAISIVPVIIGLLILNHKSKNIKTQ